VLEPQPRACPDQAQRHRCPQEGRGRGPEATGFHDEQTPPLASRRHLPSHHCETGTSVTTWTPEPSFLLLSSWHLDTLPLHHRPHHKSRHGIRKIRNVRQQRTQLLSVPGRPVLSLRRLEPGSHDLRVFRVPRRFRNGARQQTVWCLGLGDKAHMRFEQIVQV
jgi:hypothetical protein